MLGIALPMTLLKVMLATKSDACKELQRGSVAGTLECVQTPKWPRWGKLQRESKRERERGRDRGRERPGGEEGGETERIRRTDAGSQSEGRSGAAEDGAAEPEAGAARSLVWGSRRVLRCLEHPESPLLASRELSCFPPLRVSQPR